MNKELKEKLKEFENAVNKTKELDTTLLNELNTKLYDIWEKEQPIYVEYKAPFGFTIKKRIMLIKPCPSIEFFAFQGEKERKWEEIYLLDLDNKLLLLRLLYEQY